MIKSDQHTEAEELEIMREWFNIEHDLPTPKLLIHIVYKIFRAVKWKDII